jgi:glycosyltransferase involved in cell wall biosynthesis
MEDVLLHAGVMQLLGTPGLRCRLVLSLSTREVARIVQAQAWREGWHCLVQILATDDCAALLQRLPEDDPVSVARLLETFEKATKVIFACESNRQIWLERGLAEDKTRVILGGADPDLFISHERGNGVVGLSSAFYERKNPDIILDVVKLMRHREFVLIGRNWNQYANFEELRAQANFTYTSAPYRDYPEIYSSFDVFLSMSTLEGGPIPLVEAMMSNAVPVASRTGFAPDLIRHGRNGYIFDLDATPEEIAKLIESAFNLPGDVRTTVAQYNWNNFSAEIMKLAE